MASGGVLKTKRELAIMYMDGMSCEENKTKANKFNRSLKVLQNLLEKIEKYPNVLRRIPLNEKSWEGNKDVI
ncbi:21047_t:CDS:2 [Gigaspora margarita]|uniref:21047_t:CDS:1 n=1 Tax=Gigaspora margarita TaxID=4874 RepID=A0ABM8W6P3_GIGMA|nr:21047_t:CDS:2 [Gigaspora margarita]